MSITEIDMELIKLINKLNLTQKKALITLIKELLNAKGNIARQSIE